VPQPQGLRRLEPPDQRQQGRQAWQARRRRAPLGP
jgi:hypothetical protein